ncbi:DUF1648 domain-containing protein [candidate division WOR-3 bacterium]|nr:DUF1648 domain-containing protein [candidate division WOR-3 bacterium]
MVFNTARLDTTAVVVTIIVCTILIALSALFIIKVPYGWLWAAGMMLILAISYALSPQQYSFDGSRLIIRKAIGKTITIPLGDIQGYAIVPDLAKIRMIRMFGNGGLFGYYGMFSTAEYGPINCQLTRMKHVVIVQAEKMRYALSPRDIEKFVHTLCSVTSCSTVPVEPLQPGVKVIVRPLILILPIIVYIAAIATILLAFQSLPERIAVHFDVYGSPDRWGHKVSYLLSGVIPSTILFAMNCGIYFGMRRTIHTRTLLALLIMLVSWIQLFTLFISLDTFWLNTRGNHMVPFVYALVAFISVVVVLLFVYYRITMRIAPTGRDTD